MRNPAAEHRPFSRSSTGSTTGSRAREEGSGLGLAIDETRRSSASSARVAVESAPGRVSTFSIVFAACAEPSSALEAAFSARSMRGRAWRARRRARGVEGALVRQVGLWLCRSCQYTRRRAADEIATACTTRMRTAGCGRRAVGLPSYRHAPRQRAAFLGTRGPMLAGRCKGGLAEAPSSYCHPLASCSLLASVDCTGAAARRLRAATKAQGGDKMGTERPVRCEEEDGSTQTAKKATTTTRSLDGRSALDVEDESKAENRGPRRPRRDWRPPRSAERRPRHRPRTGRRRRRRGRRDRRGGWGGGRHDLDHRGHAEGRRGDEREERPLRPQRGEGQVRRRAALRLRHEHDFNAGIGGRIGFTFDVCRSTSAVPSWWYWGDTQPDRSPTTPSSRPSGTSTTRASRLVTTSGSVETGSSVRRRGHPALPRSATLSTASRRRIRIIPFAVYPGVTARYNVTKLCRGNVGADTRLLIPVERTGAPRTRSCRRWP